MVFVGYGVVAPEYGWDDFKGMDVKGKTLVFLINDPPLPDPGDASKLDDKMFKGKAMTYYGRWSYKYEIAAEKGAAAAVIVHETIPAAYPWSVVENSNAKTNFVIDAPDKNMGTLGIRSWITLDGAAALQRCRQRLRSTQESGPEQGLQAGLVRRKSRFFSGEQNHALQVAQRDRQARRERPGAKG